MAFFEQLPVNEVILSNKSDPGGENPNVVAGDQTTRAAVLAELPSTYGIGTIYLATTGKIYLKVANAGAATDWELVTTTAAD
jgi:hypothetical protein